MYATITYSRVYMRMPDNLDRLRREDDKMTITLLGVGDVGPIHEPVSALLRARETHARRGRPPLRAGRARLLGARCAPGALGRRPQPGQAPHGVDLQRLRIRRRVGRQQSRDGLGRRRAARHDRALARRKASRRSAPAATSPRRASPRSSSAAACASRSSPTARYCTRATRRSRTSRASRRCAFTPTTSPWNTSRASRRAWSPMPYDGGSRGD